MRGVVSTLFCCTVLACLLLMAGGAALAAPAGEKAYSGNVNTGKYHNSTCRYFNCKACTVRFSSAEEAKRKGFVACRKCGG